MTPSDFTSLYRGAIRDLYDSRARLKTLAERAPAILSTLPDGALAGSNSDITKSDLTDGITAAGELETHLTDFEVNPNVPTATNITLQKLL